MSNGLLSYEFEGDGKLLVQYSESEAESVADMEDDALHERFEKEINKIPGNPHTVLITNFEPLPKETTNG